MIHAKLFDSLELITPEGGSSAPELKRWTICKNEPFSFQLAYKILDGPDAEKTPDELHFNIQVAGCFDVDGSNGILIHRSGGSGFFRNFLGGFRSLDLGLLLFRFLGLFRQHILGHSIEGHTTQGNCQQSRKQGSTDPSVLCFPLLPGSFPPLMAPVQIIIIVRHGVPSFRVL